MFPSSPARTIASGVLWRSVIDSTAPMSTTLSFVHASGSRVSASTGNIGKGSVSASGRGRQAISTFSRFVSRPMAFKARRGKPIGSPTRFSPP